MATACVAVSAVVVPVASVAHCTAHCTPPLPFPGLTRSYSPPLVGNVAPDFEAEAVFDQEFVKNKLSEYIGKKYVVVFFYPLDFTFVCPAEITAFRDKHEEFEKLNTEVIGVSTNSVVMP
ncbi:hypothetical protein R1sor_000123 [Riccia sorocarpa]|uniref:Thioredoxin domain-containing protein n=1 Tax=Riccia sorocarpa TaxID=122646 RepID=A0ABD3GTW3_9MARC